MTQQPQPRRLLNASHQPPTGGRPRSDPHGLRTPAEAMFREIAFVLRLTHSVKADLITGRATRSRFFSTRGRYDEDGCR
jgi:hypothetical protein